MNKFIVTTTIQPPTEATLKFSQKKGWKLIVVGDTKTPHEEYEKINCIYLHPEEQIKLFQEVSEAIGWKTIQRRNIGFLYAYKLGADIVATVDDDNIPYETWGEDLLVGKDCFVDFYETKNTVFDPLSVTEHNWLWHRGYPIEEIPTKNNVTYIGKKQTRVLVQADLWDGDPDIDATNRLTRRPLVKFNNINPYSTYNLTVFNSQNTFIHRDALKNYMVFPHIGRMDDIWGAYYLQKFIPRGSIVFNKPTVYQDRNKQDLVTNLEKEIIGYRNTLKFIKGDYSLPENTEKFLQTYRKGMESL
jgi:hypothetical protein